MGASAEELIAFKIQTTADLAGAQQAQAAIKGLGQTVVAVGSEVNSSIGAFEAYGKTIDVTSTAAVKKYREQGDALSANLAALGATEQELNKIGAAITKVERSAGASIISPNSAQSQQLSQLPGKARTAANAVGILSQAAVTGQGSMAGLAVAAGNVATGLADVSKNSKLVAGATGIGAIITIAGIAYGAFHEYTETTKHLNEQLADLASETRGLNDAAAGNKLGQQLESINRGADAAIRPLKEMHFHEDERNKVIGEINEKRQKEIALARQQNDADDSRQVANFQLAAAGFAEDRYQAQLKIIALDEAERTKQGFGEQAKPASTTAIVSLNRAADEAVRSAQQQATQLLAQLENDAAGRRAAVDAQYQEEVRNIDTLALREGDRAKIMAALNDQRSFGLQLLEREQDLTNRQAHAEMNQLSDRADTQLSGRLEQIQIEKQAQIDVGVDGTIATETAERKKRALYAETARQANQDAASIFSAMIDSQNKTLHAIGTWGETLRRIAIGALAAQAGVEGAIEAGRAIAAAAHGDFAGAAGHAAAALKLEAAAAMGAREALGGGGSSGGGSGGGGYSGGSSQSASSNDAGGVGGTTIIVQVVDPTSRGVTQQVAWMLQRNGTLNRPLIEPPVNGRSLITVGGY